MVLSTCLRDVKEMMKKVYSLVFFYILYTPMNVYATNISPQEPLKEAYWKPTDEVIYDIELENIWEASCFVEGLNVNRLKIADRSKNMTYSIEEAQNGNFSDQTYQATLWLGDILLFEGTLGNLVDENIMFSKPIFFEEESKLHFTLAVDFDDLSGNTYQNKEYVYQFVPLAYQVIEQVKPEGPQTGVATLGLLMISTLLIGYGVYGVFVKKGECENEK